MRYYSFVVSTSVLFSTGVLALWRKYAASDTPLCILMMFECRLTNAQIYFSSRYAMRELLLVENDVLIVLCEHKLFQLLPHKVGL